VIFAAPVNNTSSPLSKCAAFGVQGVTTRPPSGIINLAPVPGESFSRCSVAVPVVCARAKNLPVPMISALVVADDGLTGGSVNREGHAVNAWPSLLGKASAFRKAEREKFKAA
jgi:hypothetical protein